MKQHLLVLGVLAFVGLACGDDEHDAHTTSTKAAQSSASSGSGGMTTVGSGGGGSSAGGAGGSSDAITVSLTVDPTTMNPGDTINGTVVVENFVLEEPAGQPNEPGHGHYHVYLDGAQGTGYLVADQSPTTLITIPLQTTPGPHTLRISLGQNNHAPLQPPVEEIIDITVQ
jgi:hypothetical protein